MFNNCWKRLPPSVLLLYCSGRGGYTKAPRENDKEDTIEEDDDGEWCKDQRSQQRSEAERLQRGIPGVQKFFATILFLSLMLRHNALCDYRSFDSSQIFTTAAIFLLYNYFRQKYLEIASCAVSLLIYNFNG